MSDIVIRADDLGKKYVIGHESRTERYSALRDVIATGIQGVIRKSGDLLKGRPVLQGDTHENLWALKHASFEVRRGEVVGIIGRNGAGKSTLLKILSRITEPTEGRVRLRGRLASLLEVGTGFHPELTGRENIYLNGTILGMRRSEINKNFDEIVAFAEIQRFIDTPVKRYSSGMYLRLAFSVAAHLEPEILIVDEVLAVGDLGFQTKCLGKLNDVANGGRTVLFVSHNMAAIAALCSRCLMIDAGRIVKSGSVDDTIQAHLQQSSTAHLLRDLSTLPRPRNLRPILRSLQIVNQQRQEVSSIGIGDSALIIMGLKSTARLSNVVISVHFMDELGGRAMSLQTHFQYKLSLSMAGSLTAACHVRNVRLRPGFYTLEAAVWSEGARVDNVANAGTFRIHAADVYGTGRAPTTRQGVYVPDANWSFESVECESLDTTRNGYQKQRPCSAGGR